MMQLSLEIRDNAPFEIGACLHALLCYPTFSHARRMRIANAICAQIVKDSIELEPHRKAELRPLLKEYRIHAARASIDTLELRRQQAAVAGQAFLPLIKKKGTGTLPTFLKDGQKLSRWAVAVSLWPDQGDDPDAQYVSRVRNRQENDLWPWYPVAHIACAYQFAARVAAGDNDNAPFDRQDLQFHHWIAQLSAYFATLFHATPEMQDIADQLIHFELFYP